MLRQGDNYVVNWVSLHRVFDLLSRLGRQFPRIGSVDRFGRSQGDFIFLPSASPYGKHKALVRAATVAPVPRERERPSDAHLPPLRPGAMWKAVARFPQNRRRWRPGSRPLAKGKTGRPLSRSTIRGDRSLEAETERDQELGRRIRDEVALMAAPPRKITQYFSHYRETRRRQFSKPTSNRQTALRPAG